MMFSYGSGCAASMFVLHFDKDYKKIAALTSDYKERLAQRRRVTPEEYDDVMAKRKEMFGKNDYTPQDSISDLQPGTFYLTHVDKQYKRYYSVKKAGQN